MAIKFIPEPENKEEVEDLDKSNTSGRDDRTGQDKQDTSGYEGWD